MLFIYLLTHRLTNEKAHTIKLFYKIIYYMERHYPRDFHVKISSFDCLLHKSDEG